MDHLHWLLAREERAREQMDESQDAPPKPVLQPPWKTAAAQKLQQTTLDSTKPLLQPTWKLTAGGQSTSGAATSEHLHPFSTPPDQAEAPPKNPPVPAPTITRFSYKSAEHLEGMKSWDEKFLQRLKREKERKNRAGAGQRLAMGGAGGPARPVWGSSQGRKVSKIERKARKTYDLIAKLPKSPQICLPVEIAGTSLSTMLGGSCWQQSAYTFGRNLLKRACKGRTLVTDTNPLALLAGVEFTHAAAGAHHGAACSKGACHVYTWGSNDNSQLGLSAPYISQLTEHTIYDVEEPQTKQHLHRSHSASGRKKAKGLFTLPNKLPVFRITLPAQVTMVACGDYHTLAVLANGQGVYAWGLNTNGQLGLPLDDLDPFAYPPEPQEVSAPCPISELKGVLVSSISAGASHSALVTQSDGRRGQLGSKSLAEVQAITKVSLSHRSGAGRGAGAGVVIAVACGHSHTLILNNFHQVWACGANDVRQLGLSDERDRAEPTRVSGLPSCASLDASVISAALSCQGKLLLWGYDEFLNPAPVLIRTEAPRTLQIMVPESKELLDPASTGQGPPDVTGDVHADVRPPTHDTMASAGRDASSRGSRGRSRPDSQPYGIPLVQEVKWLGDHKVRSFALGKHHAVVVVENRTMFAWGEASSLGYTAVKMATPVKFPPECTAAPQGSTFFSPGEAEMSGPRSEV
eukprot:gene2041-18218_t